MPRPSDADAFLLGYLPRLVLAHFDALETLVVARRATSGALAQRVDAEIATLPDRGPEIVSCVWQLERLLYYGLGVTPPTPPRTREEATAWCTTIDEAAAKLGDAHAVGERTGVAEALLATGARLHGLAAIAPADECVAEVVRVTRALAASWTPPPPSNDPTIRAELAAIGKAVGEAAMTLEKTAREETAAALAALHRRVAWCARSLESAYRGTPRRSVALWTEKHMTGSELMRRFAEHQSWNVPCRIVEGKPRPRILEFDKRVLFAFSDDETIGHAPPFLRQGDMEIFTVPGTTLFAWLPDDAIDLLVLDAGEDPSSKLVVNYPRDLHAALRQKGGEVAASLAACDWTHVNRELVRAYPYWILADGSKAKQLLADGGGGKSHVAVFTCEAALDAHIEKLASDEQKADFAGYQRLLMKGEALFAQLSQMGVDIMFDPSGPGRTRAFNKKMVELLASRSA